jgi:hypothetical protein
MFKCPRLNNIKCERPRSGYSQAWTLKPMGERVYKNMSLRAKRGNLVANAYTTCTATRLLRHSSSQ